MTSHRSQRFFGFAMATILATTVFAQNDAANQRAIDRSRAHFAANANRYGIGSANNELKVRSVKRGANETHIRFDQFYKGVRVFEGEAIAHIPDAGEVTVTNALRGNLDLDVAPGVTEGNARASVVRLLGIRGAADLKSSLEILPQGERSPNSRLVWHIHVFAEDDQDGTREYEVFVDAKSGGVAWMFDSLHTADAAGTGNTMYVGQVPLALNLANSTFSMSSPQWWNMQTNDMNNRQAGSGSLFTNATGVFGNYVKDSSDRATAGADAHYGMTATLAYFFNTFGRVGINDAGRKSYSRVHYGRNYQNAFWSDSCFCMTYGDGGSTFYPLVSLDVAAHEIGHGVMATEANLTYSGESGGLNESNSDIWGTVVENSLNSSIDVPDFWIGERIYRSNWSGSTYTQTKALRYMDKPSKDGASPNCWSSTLGSLNVHYSSGPNNHMFYLLANGGTSACNGASVSGVGIDKAARIWYRAITTYMTSSTKYAGARTAALAAAAALYGNGSSEYASVAAAFSAINVN